jgi:hypothetical protein
MRLASLKNYQVTCHLCFRVLHNLSISPPEDWGELPEDPQEKIREQIRRSDILLPQITDMEYYLFDHLRSIHGRTLIDRQQKHFARMDDCEYHGTSGPRFPFGKRIAP